MDSLEDRMVNKLLNYSKAMVKQIEHIKSGDARLNDMKTLAFAGFLAYYGDSHINDIYATFLQTKFERCDSSIVDLAKEKSSL